MNTAVETQQSSPRLNKHTNEGPLGKSRLRRTAKFFLVMGLIGLLPSLLNLSPALQAGGLGLIFPGAGFLANTGWSMLLMPLTFILYMISLVAWFGTGALIAPIIVWGGSAILAANMAANASAQSTWNYALYLALALVAIREGRKIITARKQTKEGLERQIKRRQYLSRAIADVKERASDEAVAGSREMSADELANMRHPFERALQPIGEFKGFNKIDQFQTSALRYQLNSVAYCLSVAQGFYTPNFHGYASEAQRRLIEQMLERPIWGYWALENMWGNFNFDFNPAGKDNIMLTGFFGLQVCLYMSNTGDRRYAEPGSLTFKWSKTKQYKHDIHSIINSIVTNHRTQEFGLYPCEPNWVYTPCNFMGMKALAIYDRLFGTAYFKEIYPNFIEKLDAEFTRIDGSIMPLRSNLTGFAINFPFADDIRSYFFNVIDHDRAIEGWAFAREEMTYYDNGQLKIRLDGKGLDMGNYTKTEVANIQNIMTAAREFGDQEVADAAFAMLETDYRIGIEDGVLTYKGSNANNANIVRARLTQRNDWRNLVLVGPSETTLSGPILTDVSYPDVLVAKAYSHTGSDLDLVLYPGTEAHTQAITIERLQANASYLLTINEESKTVTTNVSGVITEQVHLTGRTTVVLTLNT